MNLQFNAAVVIDTDIYFSAKNFNGLFKLNLYDKSVHFIAHFPGDEVWTEHMHQFAIQHKGFMYFIPYFAHYLTKYNLQNGEIEKICIFNNCCDKAISCVLEFENKYVLIPRKLSNPIAIFDPESDEIKYLPIAYEKKDLINLYSDIYSSIIVKNELLIPIFDNDLILKINLHNKKCSGIILSDTRNSSITYFNNKYWIVSSDGKEIRCYSEEYNLIKKYDCSGKSDRPFEGWINTGSSLYLCGCLEDELIKYDEIKDEWRNIPCDGLKIKKDCWAFMCGFSQTHHKLFIFPSATNALTLIDDKGKIQIIEINYNDFGLYEQIKMKKCQYYFETCNFEVQTERQDLSLEDMLCYLLNS